MSIGFGNYLLNLYLLYTLLLVCYPKFNMLAQVLYIIDL
jgi:hypothetical protein